MRGGSRLNTFVALLLTAGLILAAVRIVPVYVRSYEFEDAIRSEARFAGVNQKSPIRIQGDLYRKALQLNLPVRAEAISVVPTVGSGVRISVRYTVPVDLIVYQHSMNFNLQVDTQSVY